MRKWAVVGAVLSLILVELARPAAASETPKIVVPLVAVVFGDPGSVHVLATEPVPSDLIGRECTVSIVAENNESVRHGTTLTLASGSSVVVVPDVEAEPNTDVHVEQPLTLGAVLILSVTLGPEGAFSGGATVTVDCPTPAPTTTTPTTTTPTTTTRPGAPTTVPLGPPVVPTRTATVPESPLPAVPVEATPTTMG